MLKKGRIIVIFLCSIVSTTALTCPFCNTETGQQVYSKIFNDSFWTNVVITIFPFIIFALIGLALHFGLSWKDNSSHQKEAKNDRDS